MADEKTAGQRWKFLKKDFLKKKKRFGASLPAFSRLYMVAKKTSETWGCSCLIWCLTTFGRAENVANLSSYGLSSDKVSIKSLTYATLHLIGASNVSMGSRSSSSSSSMMSSVASFSAAFWFESWANWPVSFDKSKNKLITQLVIV